MRFKPAAAVLSTDKSSSCGMQAMYCNDLEDKERTNVWAPKDQGFYFRVRTPELITFECLGGDEGEMFTSQ